MTTNTNSQTASGNGRPSLSACMIVKNEERFIARCLQSIKDAVDEIIIVDTGSTDKTVEIAQSFGAKVYHHPWRNDFSEARNHSLSHASGEWALYIDADETLEQSDIPLLHELLNDASYNAIFTAIYSDIPDGCSKHYYTRVFRRKSAYFKGIVHEQLICDGDMKQSEIRLYHSGYNLSQEDMMKKYKRTGDLLIKQVDENPDDLFAVTNLVRNFRNENNNEKVIELGERGLSIPVNKADISQMHQRQRIALDLANALSNTNQLDRAEAVCRKALSECPDFIDNLLQLSYILIAKKAYKEAIHYLKKFLVIQEKERSKPGFNLLLVDSYYSGHKAYYGLGECFKRLGLLKEAETAYKKAIEILDTNPVYYLNLAHLYISQNLLTDAEKTVRAAINQGITDDAVHLLLGKILSAQGKPDEAIDILKQSVSRTPTTIPASTYVHLINQLIQAKRLGEAENILKTAQTFHPDHFGLICLREKIKFKSGNREGIPAFIQHALNSTPPNSAIALELGYFCIEMGEYPLAIDLLEKHLHATSPDANILSNIACCYAKMGKIESAIIGFQAALVLDPTCHHASQNLKALQHTTNKATF